LWLFSTFIFVACSIIIYLSELFDYSFSGTKQCASFVVLSFMVGAQ
jgi:hypothetical protein